MYYDWQPYVPVAVRLTNARKFAAKKAKKEGRELTPVRAAGRKLTKNFWGTAWCDNLDQYSDYANRLPRGRRYLGNGSVVDLQIKSGSVVAIVAGTEVYHVAIAIKTLAKKRWQSLQRDCAQSIQSLMELLQGRFDEGVMQRLAHPTNGLFPKPAEIEMDCSCPDSAGVCKHVAAVMYGVGVRLDSAPELLFTLRNVDHTELIAKAVEAENLDQSLGNSTNTLGDTNLQELFGIDIVVNEQSPPVPAAKKARSPRKRVNAVKSSATTAVVNTHTKAPSKKRVRKSSAKNARARRAQSAC